MVLETILYFALGFLSAALLALMISPAIWNRAVLLTKRKIESSVPLTLNEIQADKDQLRAEFAMSTRRLEMSVEELRDKASAQLIEINRRRDEVNKLEAKSREWHAELKSLEATSAELAAKLEEREAKLEDLNERHSTLKTEHDALKKDTRKLEQDYSTSEQTLKSREIELSASNATVEALKGTVSAINMTDDDRLALINDLKEQLANAKTELREANAATKLAQRNLATARKKLEKQTREIGEKRQIDLDEQSSLTDLNAQLIDEKAKTFELETKLAKKVLQIEALLEDASNENVKEALDDLREEFNGKSETLQSLRDERDRLASELEAMKAATNENWSDERQEKAYMRERINDLAAQVAAMTASLEGDSSPINDILKSEKPAARKAKKTKAKSKENPSLADRIRAIQEAASSN